MSIIVYVFLDSLKSLFLCFCLVVVGFLLFLCLRKLSASIFYYCALLFNSSCSFVLSFVSVNSLSSFFLIISLHFAFFTFLLHYQFLLFAPCSFKQIHKHSYNTRHTDLSVSNIIQDTHVTHTVRHTCNTHNKIHNKTRI